MQTLHGTKNSYSLNDDQVGCLSPGMPFGTAFRTVLITGGELVFQEGTSYPAEDYLDSWEKLENLRFDMSNEWVEIVLDYWRGISSALEPGIAVTPFMYRSPLDLAQSIRGNDLFLDLYDFPDEVDKLVSFCTDWLISFDKFLRDEFPVLESATNGVSGYGFNTKCMRLNGDPVDLISEDAIRRFHTPSIYALSAYAKAIFFHHHSVGIRTATVIGETQGITIQQFLQDPNTPDLLDAIDDTLIESSLQTPIQLQINLASVKDLEGTVASLARGRFIVNVVTEKQEECCQLIERIRSLEPN